jgi:hypothetical protein
MNSSMASARNGALSSAGASSAAQPQRKAPVLPDRLPVRVLQTGRAPAQLSLFLRPSSSIR